MALLNMRGWLAGDLLPPHDFGGYVSVVEEVRDAVVSFGYVPAWSSKWFAGSTRFTSTFKELATLPLAVWLDPITAVQIMVLITKVLAGLAMYVLFLRLFGSPSAAIVAGYAYAFSAPANYHTSVHLHVSMSYVLLPLVFYAFVELLRQRSRLWAAALGVLVACQFSNNNVLLVVCLAVVILLVALRPWRRLPGEDNPLTDRKLGLSWCALFGMALSVFALFGASQLAWLGADLPNHPLHSPGEVAQGVERFVEHSPFVYFNRANWLGPWLASHHPPGMPLFPEEPLRNQRHYLGIVAMIVCAAGWFQARRNYSLRRWYQVFGLLFLFQYWLSIGPRTLIWQISRTFHWPDSTERFLEMAFTAASLGSLACALVLYLRWRRARTRGLIAPRVDLALTVALLFLFASHSLFEAARYAFAPLQGMRAPGRFFELAPFAFYSLVGVGLVAIQDALPTRKLAYALTAVTAILVIVDFWPSRTAFYRGAPLRPVREFRELVATLPGEGGTLRIALFPWESAVGESLVAAASEAGVAWSWLPWQAGKYWPPYFRGTMLPVAEELDPEEREIFRPVSEALARVGRLKYFLGHPDHDPGPAWKKRAANEAFALWERPDVKPMAHGYRSYVLFVGENDLLAALSLYVASERNLLSISGGARLSDVPPGLVGGAAVIVSEAEATLSDDPGRSLADRYADKVFVTDSLDVSEFSRRLTAFLSDWRPAPLLDVRYRRPSPTHIVLETEVGDGAATIFVAEAYHPWWRAAVDGRPARVLRAHMTFMAVEVPPGTHRIDMRLECPLVVQAADWVTVLSWAALAVAAPAYGMVRLTRRRA